jgi:AbrB family looped-hinge helix DNA binding protein
MKYLTSRTIVDSAGKILIPETTRKEMGIEKGDILEITSIGNVIVIEKCEGDNDA